MVSRNSPQSGLSRLLTFPFIVVVGLVIGNDSTSKVAIINDISEPARQPGERLPGGWDLFLRLIRNTSQVRDEWCTR